MMIISLLSEDLLNGWEGYKLKLEKLYYQYEEQK